MNAKNAIKKQLMKEYIRKNFQNITVKSLCAATPTARTTLYSYFDNTDDVIREIEDELIRELVAVSEETSAGDLPGMDFPLFMDKIENYIKENWTYIYAFLICQPNFRFIRKWKDAIKVNFSKRYPDKQQINNYDAVSEILASSMLSAYTFWMEHPDQVNTSEIKPLLQNILDSLVTFI